MSTPTDTSLRSYGTTALELKGRLLTMTLNRRDSLNAVNREMHEKLSDAFSFAALVEHAKELPAHRVRRANRRVSPYPNRARPHESRPSSARR